MTEQAQVLANLISAVRRGLHTAPGAMKVLRAICRQAAEDAPDADLIRMAQFLYDLRVESGTRDSDT